MTTLWNKIFGKSVQQQLVESTAVLESIAAQPISNKRELYASELEHKATLYEKTKQKEKAAKFRQLIESYVTLTKPATPLESLAIAQQWTKEAQAIGARIKTGYMPLVQRITSREDLDPGYSSWRSEYQAGNLIDAELSNSPLKGEKYATAFKELRNKKIDEKANEIRLANKQEYARVKEQLEVFAREVYGLRRPSSWGDDRVYRSHLDNSACEHGCFSCRLDRMIEIAPLGHLDTKRDSILEKIQTGRTRQITGEEYKLLDRAYRLSTRTSDAQ